MRKWEGRSRADLSSLPLPRLPRSRPHSSLHITTIISTSALSVGDALRVLDSQKVCPLSPSSITTGELELTRPPPSLSPPARPTR